MKQIYRDVVDLIHKLIFLRREYSVYKTRKSACALLLIDAQKNTIDSLGSSTTGVARFLYTPSIMQNKA